MKSSDNNRFIKQHIELYGEELFLNSSLPLTDKGFSKVSKKSLLSDVKTNLSIHVNQKNYDLNSNQVFGSGDSNADLVIIGESPGDYESESGKPFAGSSGKLLDKILKGEDPKPGSYRGRLNTEPENNRKTLMDIKNA